MDGIDEWAKRPERSCFGEEGRQGESNEIVSEETPGHCSQGCAEALGFVYFVETQDSLFIKIGYSRHPLRRFHQLCSTVGPLPLRLLSIHRGTRETEEALHRTFGNLQYRGEWFHNRPPLTGVVAGFASANAKPLLESVTASWRNCKRDFNAKTNHFEIAQAGGLARARNLTASQRSEIARIAAKARWNGRGKK